MDKKTIETGKGVTFFYWQDPVSMAEVKYFDICVEPGVKKVTFPRKRSTWCDNVNLKYVNKQFPDVEELEITDGIQIDISNFMFPNVKKVISKTPAYKSGSCLIKKRKSEASLLNTFCKKPEDTIDLEGVTLVYDNAFSGCLSTNIIHADKVRHILTNAFQGSVVSFCHYTNLGKVVLSNTDVLLELEDQNTEINRLVVFEPKIKKVITHNEKSMRALLYEDKHIEEVQIHDENAVFQENWSCCGMKILVNNSLYKTTDDTIYTADQKNLVSYNKSECSNIRISDGVETICSKAFYNQKAFCNQKTTYAVSLPDTVKQIMPEAFDSGLTEIELGQGLQIIHDCAFSCCDKVTEITIPDSLVYFGKKNFSSLQVVSCNHVPMGLLVGIIKEVPNSSILPDNLVLELHIGGETYWLPKYMNVDFTLLQEIELKMRFGTADHVLLYDEISKPELKQETALQLYEKTKDDKLHAYLRRAAKNMANRYVSSEEEDKLVHFLEQDFLTNSALKEILQKAQRHNMASAAAYILSKIEDKTTFRL